MSESLAWLKDSGLYGPDLARATKCTVYWARQKKTWGPNMSSILSGMPISSLSLIKFTHLYHLTRSFSEIMAVNQLGRSMKVQFPAQGNQLYMY